MSPDVLSLFLPRAFATRPAIIFAARGAVGRGAHPCALTSTPFRRLDPPYGTCRRVSIASDSGASWLMNTGSRLCDLNCQPRSASHTHSLIRSAISMGGLDCGAGGRTMAP